MKKKRLARTCAALKLPHPSRWTLELVLAELKICVKELRKLKPVAAKKHKELLIERLDYCTSHAIALLVLRHAGYRNLI